MVEDFCSSQDGLCMYVDGSSGRCDRSSPSSLQQQPSINNSRVDTATRAKREGIAPWLGPVFFQSRCW